MGRKSCFSLCNELIKPPLQVGLEASLQWLGDRRPARSWQDYTTTTKTNQCPYCAYNTTHIHNLKRHILKHTGEKPFSCQYCSFNTTRKELLKEHINIHTGEKPFSCPFCSYSSSHKNILKVHIRTHTGEKPYACNFCPYRCTSKTNLNSHLLTHKSKSYCATASAQDENNV